MKALQALPTFNSLTRSDLIEYIRALELRVRELEDAIKPPKKTSSNSSSRPSSDIKSNTPSSSTLGKKRKGHGKGGRKLQSSPDETIVSQLEACPDCGEDFDDDSHSLHARYDHFEFPKIKPIVTRMTLYTSHCGHCKKDHVAPAPVGYEQGTPFGKSIETFASYLRYCNAISYERLVNLLSEMFGLKISEGGLSNLLKRVNNRVEPRVDEIKAEIRQSDIIYSDETSARVKSKTQWQWVFQNKKVCLHVILPSRGKKVVEEVMAGHRPTFWGSDLYSSQRNHADQWQICLAHQLRDCEYTIDCGDEEFGKTLRRIFWRATGIAKRRKQLAPNTLMGYRYDLDRQLDRCLRLIPKTEKGRKLKKRMLRERGNLFTFFDHPDLEPTNNSSERALRPSVIFRKVTNCFRSDWGKDVYAGVRSVIDTGQRQGLSAYDSIQKIVHNETIFVAP